MTDRPILFPAPMLPALRDGRKTQVRRMADSALAGCARGDRLWVQEAFAPMAEDGDDIRPVDRNVATVAMMKDGWHQQRGAPERSGPHDLSDGRFHRARWAPALKMPRWASRLTLIVEEARILPLQAIGRADAIAEGLDRWPPRIGGLWRWPSPHHRRLWLSPVAAFGWLWDTTHGTPGERWADDPLVVAITFTAVAGNIDSRAPD